MRRSTTVLALIAVAIVAVALLLRSQDGDAPEGPTTTVTAPQGTTSTGAESPTSSIAPTTTSTLPPPAIPEGLEVCDLYDDVAQTGTLSSNVLVEASGLAVSRVARDVLWSHNDSRGGPILHAFSPSGEDLGAYEIPGAFALDWEDLAIGPGADGTGSFLYVGDTGDNFLIRGGSVNLWQVPDVDPASLETAFPSATPFVYEMDEPDDVEALFIDPIDPAVYLITKSRSVAHVYRGELVQTGAPQPMERVHTLFLDAEVSGADITADGSVIALRGYRTVWMWQRAEGQSIAEALAGQPCEAPSPEEKQGESIAFDASWGYYTISEGTNPAINYVAAGR